MDKYEREKSKRRDRRRSRSRSREGLNSKKDDFKNFDSKLQKMRNNQKINKKHPNFHSDSYNKSNLSIKLHNKGILTNIIQNNLKTNIKLDNEEVDRATQKLQTIDRNTNKQAVLLSSHINKITNKPSEDEDYIDHINGEIEEIILRPYLCSFSNCGLRFKWAEELKTHLNSHLD